MHSNDKNKKTKESKTGRYIYDRKLGKVVKVSDEIVGLNKAAASGTGRDACPMNPDAGGGCEGCGHGDWEN